MKAPRLFRRIAALAAFAGAALAASAQLTTFSTIPGYTGSDISGGAATTFTQTFTQVVGVQSMTYRFVRPGTTGPNTVPTDLTYYFTEWDTATNRATTLLDTNTITVPGAASFTTYQYTDPTWGSIDYLGYDYQITLNSTGLNATKTYAMVLQNSNSFLKLELINSSDLFAWGSAYTATGTSTFADLQTTSSSAYAPTGTDWGFQQIVVDLAPIPEPATAAAGVGAALVLGLVALRQYRRRQEQSALALVPASR